jgi:hypothetical protein
MRFGVTKILTNYKVASKQKVKYVDIEACVQVLGLKKLATSNDFWVQVYHLIIEISMMEF